VSDIQTGVVRVARQTAVVSRVSAVAILGPMDRDSAGSRTAQIKCVTATDDAPLHLRWCTRITGDEKH